MIFKHKAAVQESITGKQACISFKDQTVDGQACKFKVEVVKMGTLEFHTDTDKSFWIDLQKFKCVFVDEVKTLV